MSEYRPIEERRRDWDEVEVPLAASACRERAQACMSCGLPFCHGLGCPLANPIPETNAAVAAGDDALAHALLAQTDPFPEFTSRVCPALCEGSCTRGMDGGAPVDIRALERHISDAAWAAGLVRPEPPARRLGLRVAVVGSGPAGLAAAERLNRAGVDVTVYERDHAPGGLLRYGIPDFKLDKRLIDRRIELLEFEGICFVCDAEIGRDIAPEWLAKRHDAVLWAVGAGVPRDLPISAAGRRVVVIGGGDTGSDCVGTAIRQGAASVTQIEILPRPPETRSPSTPWPRWPWKLRTSSSHEEGGERLWSVETLAFEGTGHVEGVRVRDVAWTLSPFGKPLSQRSVEGSERTLPADLVLLAMGFTGVPEGLLAALPRQERPFLCAETAGSPHVACGDCVTGPSLVVRALADARRAADALLARLTAR